jgi:hypothetical protein
MLETLETLMSGSVLSASPASYHTNSIASANKLWKSYWAIQENLNPQADFIRTVDLEGRWLSPDMIHSFDLVSSAGVGPGVFSVGVAPGAGVSGIASSNSPIYFGTPAVLGVGTPAADFTWRFTGQAYVRIKSIPFLGDGPALNLANVAAVPSYSDGVAAFAAFNADEEYQTLDVIDGAAFSIAISAAAGLVVMEVMKIRVTNPYTIKFRTDAGVLIGNGPIANFVKTALSRRSAWVFELRRYSHAISAAQRVLVGSSSTLLNIMTDYYALVKAPGEPAAFAVDLVQPEEYFTANPAGQNLSDNTLQALYARLYQALSDQTLALSCDPKYLRALDAQES